MLIQGSCKTDRTKKIIEYYVSLLDKGVSASNILVLCLNSYKKNIFIQNVKKELNTNFYENPNIYTFYGFVYNTIINNWPTIENSIEFGKPTITPHMTGLELSELFFKSAIKEIGFHDYNSKVNLIHQLFRRHSLITNNNLSDSEVKMRSDILSEPFGDDAKKTIDIYKKRTLEFRALDYIRQMGIFNYLIKNSNCLEDIKYLIVDDADEITPFEFDFIKNLYSKAKEICIGYDAYGTSRAGFLNADLQTVENIKNLFKNETLINLDERKYCEIKPVHIAYSRRLEMVYAAINKVVSLIKTGVNPSDIAIITPINDTSLKHAIKEIFNKEEINYQFLSGNEKLNATPLVKNVLTILKLAIGEQINVYEYRLLIANLLKIPIKDCMPIISAFKNDLKITAEGLNIEKYKNRMNLFIDLLEKIKDKETTLSDKIFEIIKNLLELDKNEIDDLSALSFLVKQIQDIETVFDEHKTNIKFLKTILTQFENSIISENASNAIELKDNSIIISTVQKIIDYSIKTKYQIWLDISSNEWSKDDLGTIYNAWVFQKSWNKNEFTYEDNIELSKQKTQKQLRKLSLLCDKIYAFSSYYDLEGNENIGGIEKYLSKADNKTDKISKYSFTPRDDQKSILDYKNGKMAISAVPGAGKTTVLLALIIKLLQDGVNSENIFVLTYMESAARNIKERIKTAIPNLEKTPNISTIHGLALRILKENSNYLKVGLNENFEVCDDNIRQKILRESILQLQLEQDNYDKYEKGISILKLSNAKIKTNIKDIEIQNFLKLYKTYNKNLKQQNYIDYDDMLLLSVKLLENNKDICQYYQNICQYLIEDEAQDSSKIQQQLLNLLSSQHNNLIRCGDINQSITTTFTNSDLDGFRNYIKTSTAVMMNKSQRCTKEIYTLANNLIEFANKTNELKNAFYNIKMQEVEGKNPISNNAVTFELFDDYKEEQSYILEKIRKIQKENNNSTIAILVRNNFQIDDYAKVLSLNGYNVITQNDTLESQPVFALIYQILKFCTKPWDNNKVIDLIKTFKHQKLYAITETDINFLKSLSDPFITQNDDILKSQTLTQICWDLNYWIQNLTDDIESFGIKVGNYYYETEIEKSNVYVIALLLKNLYSQYKNLDILVEKLEEISTKPILSKYKFFEQENKTQNINSIQIMTYHKSKGDEFDYVFLPQLSEENLAFDLNNIKIKSKERFLESIKSLNLNYSKKDEFALKKFIAEENLRLLYVAITRAKKNISITCANKYKKYSKLKTTQPSIIFDNLHKLIGVKND